MKTQFLPGPNGYPIPLIHTLTGREQRICLIAHGFGSSKNSPTAQMMLHGLPQVGIGAIAFDAVAHGESPVDGSFLRLDNCLRDMAALEDWIAAQAPRAKICYFSSSFGAYQNLLYLSRYPHRGDRSFLRSAAINMSKIFSHRTPQQQSDLDTRGFTILNQGYDRPIKVTREFVADLAAHNLFALYRPGTTRVQMIHGGADTTAAPEDARRVAQAFSLPLLEVPRGEHSLDGPGQAETVLREALRFFTQPEGC